MILGVDHIALSCINLQQSVKVLEKSGYICRFTESKLLHHPAKLFLLRNDTSTHAIAYCQPPDGVAIELICNNTPLNGPGSLYQVVFSSAPHETEVVSDKDDFICNLLRKLFNHTVQKALWHPFNIPIWHTSFLSKLDSSLISLVVIQESDISAAERFWMKGLGASIIRRKEVEWILLAFRSPIKTWKLDVLLVQSICDTTIPYLDDAGFPCLALITTNLTEDVHKAVSEGALEASEPFSFVVGGKKLMIALLRGPGNELIELIQINK
jgi:hypothetical protein